MGQKTNPLALRIQSSKRSFDQAWYSDYFFSKLIETDLIMSQYINNFLKALKLPQARLSIQHLSKSTKLYTFFCYPKQSREYKTRIFRVSSGLPNLHKKQSLISQRVKIRKRNALLDSELFQQFSFKEKFFLNLVLDFYISTIFNSKLKLNSQNTKKYKISKNLLLLDRLSNGPFFYNNQLTKYSTPFKPSNNGVFYNKFHDFLLNYYQNFNLFLQEKNNKYSIVLPLFKFLLISSNKVNRYNNSLVAKSNKCVTPAIIFNKEEQKYKSIKIHLKKNQLLKNIVKSETSLKYNTYLQTNLSSFFNSVVLSIPFRSQYEWQDAGYFADEIVFLLERRVSFRQIKSKLLRQLIENPRIQGLRITCSGRVGGRSKKSQRAKIDSIKYGQTSLHVFSSQIDFAVRTAYTALGSTGVKVWICYKSI
jgi:hypothetical protein